MPLDKIERRTLEINQLHDEICGTIRTTLDKAIRAGELLAEQKEAVGHGNFGAWMIENLSFSAETARNYMRVFRHREELESVKITDLSEAYRHIRNVLMKADPASDEVEVKFTLTKKEAEEYAQLWKHLAEKVFYKTNEKDTILAALSFAFDKGAEG